MLGVRHSGFIPSAGKSLSLLPVRGYGSGDIVQTWLPLLQPKQPRNLWLSL